MKKILFLSLFISFKMFGQAPKMDVVVATTENIDGIRAVLNKTNPTNSYSAIKGTNKATNNFGYGVEGVHLGSGHGVYGQSALGFGVAGFSTNLGVFGRGDLAGVLGQSISGTGVTGASSSGIAGHFESASGYALITGTGNVGIGLSSPTFPLDVNGRIRLRNNGGNNTSGIWFDNTAAALRVFMGMETDDLFGFYGTPGWSFRFNATNGNIGISTVPTANKLEVNGSIGSVSLAGTGNNQLYANSTGTIFATGPVAFSVKSNVGLTPIANVTVTTFPFNSENYDLGSFYDNSLYEFNAPLNAIYHFDCAITFGVVNSAGSTAGYEMSILVDEVSSAIFRKNLEVGGYETLTLSQDIKLNAGQKVKITVYQNSGNTIQLIGDANSYFTGRLVTRL